MHSHLNFYRGLCLMNRMMTKFPESHYLLMGPFAKEVLCYNILFFETRFLLSMHKYKIFLFLLILPALIAGILCASYFFQPLKNKPGLSQTHDPVQFIAALQHDQKRAEKIAQQFCLSCHAKQPVIATQAPRLGDRTSWQRYQQLTNKELLALVQHGVGEMPPRGGCFECSDTLLMETINYLRNQLPNLR